MKVRVIGRGGFCEVFECEEVDELGESTGHRIALKCLQQSQAADADTRARFQREVRLLDQSLRHPNIISVYSRNLTAEPPWFAMPLALGSLRDRMPTGEADRDWVLHIFAMILTGVAHAHTQGIIHRDLKPENVLLFEKDHACVADFGLGKAIGSTSTTLTMTWQAMGTQSYMAPEQFIEFKHVDASADVFALGKILHELLTGQHPTVGQIDVDEVPDPYKYFVQRCVSARPENRFPDAVRALEAFEKVWRDAAGHKSPIDGLQSLVARWAQAHGPLGKDDSEAESVVRAVNELLLTHVDDEELYVENFPFMPDDMLIEYMALERDGFLLAFSTYNRHVEGGLPWDYCDVVADFYERWWGRGLSLSLLAEMFSRLLRMGRSHNRWHVRDVVWRICNACGRASEAQALGDVILLQQDDGDWVFENKNVSGFRSEIVDAIATARA